MVQDITTIKQTLNREFYNTYIISQLANTIANKLDAKVDFGEFPYYINFKLAKKVAKANGFKFEDSTKEYAYVESLLKDLYLSYSAKLSNINVDMNTLLNNIQYMYRLNSIGGNTFILQL